MWGDHRPHNQKLRSNKVFLRLCTATNDHEDRNDAVAQGGIERFCSPGTGEVAGSSPASVTSASVGETGTNRG